MGFVLPVEPRYVLYLPPDLEPYAKANTDQFGDSYTTPLDTNELEKVAIGEYLRLRIGYMGYEGAANLFSD